jgi:hypothetical protein
MKPASPRWLNLSDWKICNYISGVFSQRVSHLAVIFLQIAFHLHRKKLHSYQLHDHLTIYRANDLNFKMLQKRLNYLSYCYSEILSNVRMKFLYMKTGWEKEVKSLNDTASDIQIQSLYRDITTNTKKNTNIIRAILLPVTVHESDAPDRVLTHNGALNEFMLILWDSMFRPTMKLYRPYKQENYL